MKTQFTTKRLITGIFAFAIGLMTLLTLLIPFLQVDIFGLKLSETGFSMFDFKFDKINEPYEAFAYLLGVVSIFQLSASVTTMIFAILSIFFFEEPIKNRILVSCVNVCLLFTLIYMIIGIMYPILAPYYVLSSDGSFALSDYNDGYGVIAAFNTYTLAYIGFIINILLATGYNICAIVIKTPKKSSEGDMQTPQRNIETVKGISEGLKLYKELLDAGIITQEEFEKKKQEILNS